MYGRSIASLLLSACLGLAADSGFESWAVSMGGGVEKSPEGRIVAADLSRTWVSDADLARVVALGELERLDLSHTGVTDLGLAQLAPLAGLRELRLRFAERVTEAGIASLKGWTALERLDLRGSAIRSGALESIGSMTALRWLDISHTRVTDEGFDALAELEHLEELRAGSNRLEGWGLILLKPSRSLRRLDLSGVQRVDSGIWGLPLTLENLRRIGDLTQLTALRLGGATAADTGIDRPGRDDAERAELRGLEALATLTRLEELDLSRQSVTAEGLGFLSGLRQLRSLNLGQALRVDDKIVPLLVTLPRLENLYLAGTSLTGDGLRALTEAPNLSRISLGGTLVSAGDAAEFRKARPGAQVTWFEGQELRAARTAQ